LSDGILDLRKDVNICFGPDQGYGTATSLSSDATGENLKSSAGRSHTFARQGVAIRDD
jgi:hypothetical protein